MILKAIAIDDEPPALQILENFCEEVEGVSLQKTFTQARAALQYLQDFPIDLLFLDIEMPSISGIDFYKKVQENCKMVIFTTAHSAYAVEGFNLNAVDYLLKPFTFERFVQAIEKANEYYRFLYFLPEKTAFLQIRADYSLIKIKIEDILWIEGLDDYVKIFLQNQKMQVVRMTLKTILEKLPETEFVRVHRSYIIPLSKILQVRNKLIEVAGREIPLGRSYEDAFWEIFRR